MKASIIIPFYNDKLYVQECLESVLGQSYRDIEVICVDDGSFDGSSEIVQGVAQCDDRVRVFRQKNKGLSAARNLGLAEARGEYVLFVDSDDLLSQDAVERLVCYAEKNDLDHIISGVEVFKDAESLSVSDSLLRAEKEYFRIKNDSICWSICSGTELFVRLMENDSFYVSANTRFLRRRLLEKGGIRFIEGIIHEDAIFTPEVMLSSERTVVIPDKFYKRRLRDGSIMTSIDQNVRHVTGLLVAAMKMTEVFAVDANLQKALEKYKTYLYRKAYIYLNQCDDRSLAKDSILNAILSILGEKQASLVKDIVYPLMSLCLEYDARARKYRDKRLSSRLKRLVNFKPRKKIRATDESVTEIKVSVIVPVYNAERHLRQALDSLCAQTLKDAEFICVDDGSSDGSGAILEEYAKRDLRFRVFHRINRGLAETRNFGVSQSRGEYLTFMDADDYVESVWLEEIYKISRENKLDICISDFQMFSEKTGETLPHWWTLENQAKNLVFHKVISPRRLKKWAVAGNVWSCMFNRQFIVRNEFRFLNLKPGDDLSFSYSALIKAKRIYFHPVVYYHYRRGQGTSIMDLHGKNYESQKECLATIVKFIGEIGRGFFSGAKKKAFVWRFMYDVLYAGENIPRIAHWLADGGLADYLRIEDLRRKDIGSKALLARVRSLMKNFTTSIERPKEVEKLIDDIEAARFGKKKDLYIVTGQLNSKTNEPIDSWTFFRYLQDNGIPSRYVIWRKHYFLKKIKKQGLMKDVIVLRGNGVKNFEFLNKCRKELVRAKAVIQENGAIEKFTGRWLRELPGCDYVYLQHGVFHLSLSNEVAEWMARRFNYINVSSERERDFLSHGFSLVPKESRADFLIGGLPRWDLLKDTSNKEPEKIVFVMMTWRSTFNEGMDILKKSAYYRGLKALLSKENIEMMRKMGLRVVWAPHHHLANRIKDLDFEFGEEVEVSDTREISKWIARSSMCITDFSSVSGDFLFLGKPVVYWVPDRNDPLLDPKDGNAGAKVKSACENLEKWFNVAHSEAEVMEYVKHYKGNGFKLENDKLRLANTLFDCKDGICEKLFNGLKDI